MPQATLSHIVEQHLEEAAFLWEQRRRAVDAPHYKVFELSRLDSRVEAHLDGLRVAGEEGWALCEQALAIGGAGELFVASVLALESKAPEKLARVLRVAEASPEARNGLISALGWTEPANLSGTVKRWLDSADRFQQFVGLSACGVHRADPGNKLDDWVRDASAPADLRGRALRMAGELKRRELAAEIREAFHSPQASIRFWAAWSALLLGQRGEALELLQTFVVTGSSQFPRALPLVLRALPVAQSAAWLKGLAQYPDRQRDLIAGVGAVGDPFYVPWLIKQMQAPVSARLAGEAFSFITGADIGFGQLEAERPQAVAAAPTEAAEDDRVAIDPDEDLPWPDPARVEAWWAARQHQFHQGTRYFLGAPVCEAQCRKALKEGFQRQRTAAALELALSLPDERLFETRAPGWRQRRQLVDRV